MQVANGRPGDVRGFIHKRIFGGIKGGLSGLTGGPLGILGGAFGGFARGGEDAGHPGFQLPQRRVNIVQRAVPSRADAACSPGFVIDRGQCVPVHQAPVPIQLPPPEAGAELGFGEARMGRYGAALEPSIHSMTVRTCPRGAVLGTDGLCYNRRDISNSQRFWPAGRKTLLTGGEMRAISVASSAAKKLQRKTKQLQGLGLMKAPPARRAQKRLAPGHHAHVAHD